MGKRLCECYENFSQSGLWEGFWGLSRTIVGNWMGVKLEVQWECQIFKPADFTLKGIDIL
jgi:hypothetical protein